MEAYKSRLNWAIGLGLLFPLFFQLNGGIYDGFRSDSGGEIATLPLPIALPVCYSGIVLLLMRLRKAKIAGAFLVTMLFALMLSVVFSGLGMQLEQRKAMLLAQFLIPMAALVLGQMICDENQAIPRAFLAVLLVVVPFQLLAGWMQGSLTLTHTLYVFSIYQHFQFVPVIFVAAYFYVTAALWSTHRRWLIMLFPWMCIYVMASGSFLTIGAFFTFSVAFAGKELVDRKIVRGSLVPLILAACIVLAAIVFGYYLEAAKSHSNILQSTPAGYLAKFQSLGEGKLPVNILERLNDWKLFGNGITESYQTLVFGHPAPLAREVRTSAHNWYIDIVYSFGVISLLPVAVLIGYTIHAFWRARLDLKPETRWLFAIVIFLVLLRTV